MFWPTYFLCDTDINEVSSLTALSKRSCQHAYCSECIRECSTYLIFITDQIGRFEIVTSAHLLCCAILISIVNIYAHTYTTLLYV